MAFQERSTETSRFLKSAGLIGLLTPGAEALLTKRQTVDSKHCRLIPTKLHIGRPSRAGDENPFLLASVLHPSDLTATLNGGETAH